MAMTSKAMVAATKAMMRVAGAHRLGRRCVWWGAPIVARSRLLSARSPMRPRSAGVRVRALTTATATANAATEPMTPRNGTPVTLSASSATTTVAPANTTALPEVPVARPTDSCSGMPVRNWVRWRLTMNSE